MCIPSPVVSAATTIGGILSSIFGASDQEDAYNRNVDNANQQLAEGYYSMVLRQSTEADQANQMISDLRRDSTEAQGMAAVAAAQAGVQGNSVLAMMQEFERDEGERVAIEMRNKHLREQAIESEKRGSQYRAQASIYQATPNDNSLDYLTAAGGLLKDGLGVYDLFIDKDPASVNTSRSRFDDGREFTSQGEISID